MIKKLKPPKFDLEVVLEREQIAKELGTCPKCGRQLKSVPVQRVIWTPENPRQQVIWYAVHCPAVIVDAEGNPQEWALKYGRGHFYQMLEQPAKTGK